MPKVVPEYAAKVEKLLDLMWESAETLHQATLAEYRAKRVKIAGEGGPGGLVVEKHAYRPSLWRCVCGAPTWQQPCPFCGFYPYGADPGEVARCKGTTAKDAFVRAVEAAGGFHVLFALGYRRTAAYVKEWSTGPTPATAPVIDRLIEEAKAKPSPITASELWDAIEEG